MQIESIIIAFFLTFLVLGGGSFLYSLRRGRAVCREFARQYPEKYEALGKPQPGLFLSQRRTAYMRFVMQREFESLDDPPLIKKFAALRRGEIRQLVLLLGGFGILGIVALWYEFVHKA